MDDPALTDQGIPDRVLEGRVSPAPSRRVGFGKSLRSTFREFKKVLKVADAARSMTRQRNLIGPQRRKHRHLTPRTGNSDVEPAVPTVRI